jgi:hypothetical protein
MTGFFAERPADTYHHVYVAAGCLRCARKWYRRYERDALLIPSYIDIICDDCADMIRQEAQMWRERQTN